MGKIIINGWLQHDRPIDFGMGDFSLTNTAVFGMNAGSKKELTYGYDHPYRYHNADQIASCWRKDRNESWKRIKKECDTIYYVGTITKPYTSNNLCEIIIGTDTGIWIKNKVDKRKQKYQPNIQGIYVVVCDYETCKGTASMSVTAPKELHNVDLFIKWILVNASLI